MEFRRVLFRSQAANAEKYRDLKTQERQLRAEILALRMRQFEDSGRGQETAITDFEQALEAARTRVHHSSEARVAAEIEQRAQAQKLGDEQSKVYEAEARSEEHTSELQ